MKQHTDFSKLYVSLKYWLIGKGEHDVAYRDTLRALELAKNIHNGFRKDEITPEFQHQLESAQYLRTLLPSLSYPAETITTMLLHDVAEDYGDKINHDTLDTYNFGERVNTAVRLLNKHWPTPDLSDEEMYKRISKDPISSIVKGADRINNLFSMIGVFSAEKQKKYLEHTAKYAVPMIKAARIQFVEQEAAYENIKFILNAQYHATIATIN